LAAESLISFCKGKMPGGELGDHRRMGIHQDLEILMKKIIILIYQNLPGIYLLQDAEQHRIPAVLLDYAKHELSAGDICITYCKTLFLKRNTQDKTVAVRFKKVLLHHRCGCHNLHHFPLCQLSASFRQLSLLADGDFLSGFQETLDIDFCRMVGNPAHPLAVAFCQGEIE